VHGRFGVVSLLGVSPIFHETSKVHTPRRCSGELSRLRLPSRPWEKVKSTASSSAAVTDNAEAEAGPHLTICFQINLSTFRGMPAGQLKWHRFMRDRRLTVELENALRLRRGLKLS